MLELALLVQLAINALQHQQLFSVLQGIIVRLVLLHKLNALLRFLVLEEYRLFVLKELIHCWEMDIALHAKLEISALVE